MRDALLARRIARPRDPRAAAAPLLGAVARDRPRPRRDDAARLDARRRAAGDVPAEPVEALRAARLLGDRFPPADDARGDRQLPRAQARDGESAVLEVPGRRTDRSRAEARPHRRRRGPRGATASRWLKNGDGPHFPKKRGPSLFFWVEHVEDRAADLGVCEVRFVAARRHSAVPTYRRAHGAVDALLHALDPGIAI